MPQTLYDKIWDEHVVKTMDDGSSLIYIDRHMIHEVTSPQAFEGIDIAGRKIWRKDSILATADHVISTEDRTKSLDDLQAREQFETLEANVSAHGVRYLGLSDKRQGIVLVVGPEQGFTLPGITLVCGDSHTATHGAFGALAFGIGTSEVEQVFATQTLIMRKSKNMRIWVDGALQDGVGAKDLILAIITRSAWRRHRPCDRVRRAGDCGFVDGRSLDARQHGDRSGSAFWPDRPRRDDFCLPERQALRATK
jgi:3-isopropylmalate/(R)-2-methylmalate dehydratase large subunit